MADVTLKALLLGDDFSASRALKGVAREIDDVVERLVVLNRMDATPEVKVKTAEAQAELARLQAEMKALGTETETTGKKTEHTSQQMGMLATSLIAVGPALVPIAAGAAGLAVGFGAMGSAGVLAILGIRNEMKAGTALGNGFAMSVDKVKSNLQQLERTAAANVLGSFQGAVQSLQSRMPALNGYIGEFATLAGKTGAALATGLVSALLALEPLARDAGVAILRMSQHFQTMMSGPGVVQFGDYARSVLPQVLTTIENLATTAGHLVAAFAPLGGGALTVLSALSNVINAIPVPVLATVAQLAGSIFLGFRAWQTLSGPISILNDRLREVGPLTQAAATGLRTMNIAAGVIGVAIAGLSYLMSRNAETQRQNEQAANDYADALRRSNGVIDESIRLKAAQILQDQGVLDIARQYGFSLSDVTNAALGNASAMGRVNAHMSDVRGSMAGLTADQVNLSSSTGDVNGELDKLTGAIGGQNKALNDGIQKNKNLADATQQVTGATQQRYLATMSVTTATGADATALAQLNGQLSTAISRTLTLAQADTQIDAAQLAMWDSLKKNKATLNAHTQAGIQDRQAIEASASALQSKRDLNIKEGMSQADATAKYRDASSALLAQMGRIYGTKSAAYAYMKQLLDIPKSVTTTIRANTGQAVSATQRILNMLAGIKNKDVTVTVNYLNALNKPHVGPPGSNAGGTNNWRGGLTWVGEQGPELLDLPAGSKIYPHAQSVAMSAVAGGSRSSGSGVVANLAINLRSPDGRIIEQQMVKLKRDNGGQLAFL